VGQRQTTTRKCETRLGRGGREGKVREYGRRQKPNKGGAVS